MNLLNLVRNVTPMINDIFFSTRKETKNIKGDIYNICSFDLQSVQNKQDHLLRRLDDLDRENDDLRGEVAELEEAKERLESDLEDVKDERRRLKDKQRESEVGDSYVDNDVVHGCNDILTYQCELVIYFSCTLNKVLPCAFPLIFHCCSKY